MQTGTFRKNVRKTIVTRPVKLALRGVAKDTTRTNLTLLATRLKTDTGNLLQALGPYVLGHQLTPDMRHDAFAVLGDIGADLIGISSILKVKFPASTKKTKLTGTRSAALLHLDSLTTDILSIVSSGAFNAPKMKSVKKVVVLPNKGGAKEERDVDVVDTEAEIQAELNRREELKKLVAEAIDTYFRFTHDTFGHPPAPVLQAKFDRLKEQYPDIEFDLKDESDDESEAETQTQETAQQA